VRILWDRYAFNHKTIIISEILDLSINQKKCLNALAKKPTQEPLGKDFQQEAKLSLSSLKQVIDVLIKKDIIYKDEDSFLRILDPALSYLLQKG
jgi:DNA-binding MarR family transcriptional regulator